MRITTFSTTVSDQLDQGAVSGKSWDDPKLQLLLQRLFGVRDGEEISELVVDPTGIYVKVRPPQPVAAVSKPPRTHF